MAHRKEYCCGNPMKYSQLKCVAILICPWILMIVPVILSLIFSAISKKEIKEAVGGYDNIIDNWQRGPVMEIVKTTGTDCPANFEKAFVTDWPGTQSGCDCLGISCSKSGVKDNELITGYCNANSTRCGCSDVSPTPSKTLWINPSEAEYCIRRDPDLQWIKIWENQISSGFCKDGFKKCGDVNGLTQGVCIPDNKDCPLSDIKMAASNPDATKYTEIVGESINLYWTRSNNIANPLTEFWLGEGGICVDQNFRSISDNRSDYVLMSKEGKDCKEDTRFTSLNNVIGEKDLLDNNGVIYNTLPAFNTNNNFKYDKYIRSMIAFKPSCRLLVGNTEEGHKNINKFESLNKGIFVYSIICLCVVVILYIIEAVLQCHNSFKARLILFGIRHLVSIVLVLLMIIQAFRGASKLGTFRKIGREKCADDLTNQFFEDVDADVRKYVVTWNAIASIWLGIGQLVELLLEFCFDEKCRTRKPTDKKSKYSSNSFNKKKSDKSSSSDDKKYNANNFSNGRIGGNVGYNTGANYAGKDEDMNKFNMSANYAGKNNDFNNFNTNPVPYQPMPGNGIGPTNPTGYPITPFGVPGQQNPVPPPLGYTPNAFANNGNNIPPPSPGFGFNAPPPIPGAYNPNQKSNNIVLGDNFGGNPQPNYAKPM